MSKMNTWMCEECEIYALGIEVQLKDAVCICGNQMVELVEE